MNALASFWVFEVIRYLWNLMFLILHPFIVLLGAMVLDKTDYPLFLQTDKSRDTYDRAEKGADATFYIGAILFFWHVRNRLWYAKILVVLFIYRLIGNIMFMITLWGWVPIAFCNVADVLMLIYTILDYGLPGPDYRYDRWLYRHVYWNALLIFLSFGLKIGFEVYMWLDPDGRGSAECESPTVIWSLISVWMISFLYLAIMAGYWRKPHYFEPGER